MNLESAFKYRKSAKGVQGGIEDFSIDIVRK